MADDEKRTMSGDPGTNGGDWEDFGPALEPDEIWDAFEPDDELDEPLPEYGDFWPETDGDE